MIKCQSSEVIREINNPKKERAENVLNWVKTIGAGIGIITWVWLCVGLFSGNITI